MNHRGWANDKRRPGDWNYNAPTLVEGNCTRAAPQFSEPPHRSVEWIFSLFFFAKGVVTCGVIFFEILQVPHSAGFWHPDSRQFQVQVCLVTERAIW